MQFKEKRHTELIFIPTKKWLRSRNPRSKAEILKWYEREKRILNKRRSRKVDRRFEANTALQDRDTKKLYKKSKFPEDFTIDCWKLSDQDYKAYRASLDREFKRRKKEHNEKIRQKRKDRSVDKD